MDPVYFLGSILLAVVVGMMAVAINNREPRSADRRRTVPVTLLILAAATFLVAVVAAILNFPVEPPLAAWFFSVAVSLTAIAAVIWVGGRLASGRP